MHVVKDEKIYNEQFIFKASNEISKRFDFNIIQQRALIDELYKCTKNVEIIFLHQEESDFLTYIDIYIKSKQLEGLSPGTLKNKKYMLNELNSYLTKKIEDISVADLKMYVLYKQSTCKTNSLNSIIICIKSFFKFLCEEDYLDNDPSRKLKKIKQEKRLKKSLNEITFEQIRLSCSNVRDRALLEFLYSTGVRVSELISINKDDLNYESNTLRVIGKGNKERVVIFSDITKFYLNKYLASRSDDNPALFVSVKKPYKRLSQRGVQKLLGHTSLDTTMIYAEIDNEKIAYQYKSSKL